jgi:hypothetical protein
MRAFLRATGVALALTMAASAEAYTYTFNNGFGNQYWDQSGNWRSDDGGTTYPVAGDTAVIPEGYTCYIDRANAAAALVDVSGDLTVGGHVLTVSGDCNVNSGGTLTVSTSGSSGFSAGALNVAFGGQAALYAASSVDQATITGQLDVHSVPLTASSITVAWLGELTIFQSASVSAMELDDAGSVSVLAQGGLWVGAVTVAGGAKLEVLGPPFYYDPTFSADSLSIGTGGRAKLTGPDTYASLDSHVGTLNIDVGGELELAGVNLHLLDYDHSLDGTIAFGGTPPTRGTLVSRLFAGVPDRRW